MQALSRLPVVRHVRYYWLCWCVRRHARAWAQAGIGLGHPHPADLERLHEVWRGRA